MITAIVPVTLSFSRQSLHAPPMPRIHLLLLLVLPIHHVSGQTGILDASFSADGRALTPPFVNTAGSTMYITDMDVQSFGGIIAVGIGDWMGSPAEHTDMIVARYAPDGLLDPSFGGENGYYRLDMADGYDRAYAVAAQADDRIVVVGSGWPDPDVTGSDLVVLRLLPNGAVDNTFNGIGIRTLDIGGSGQVGNDVIIRSNGKIVVVGSTSTPSSDSDFLVVQLNADGSLDNSFSFDGIQTTSLDPTSYETAQAVVELSNGELVVAGNTESEALLVRYLSNGTLDLSFSGDGKAVFAPLNSDPIWLPSMRVTGIDADDAGRLYVSATLTSTNVMDPSFTQTTGYILRCLPNGDIDPEFQWLSFVNHDVNAVALMDNGSFLCAGSSPSYPADPSDMVLWRFSANGQPEPVFGNNGRLEVDFNNGHDRCTALRLQPDGRVLIGGATDHIGDSRYQFALARVLNDPDIGVAEFTLAANASIYPVPVAEGFQFSYTLATPTMLSCSLVDMQGRVVRTFFQNTHRTVGPHHEPLSVDGVAPGRYQVLLQNEHGTCSLAIIKQ